MREGNFMFCRFCGKELPEGARFCNNCGRAADVMPLQQAVRRRPMAWFKFIIYFQLFANAAGNLIIAFMWITGLHYGESAGLYYEVCPPLKAVDVIYGLICIACAVGAILVRQKLAHYKKSAPAWYIGFIAVSLILSLISSVAVYLAVTFASEGYLEIKLAELMRYAVIVIAGVCFHIPLNYVYFIKRKDLFVN